MKISYSNIIGKTILVGLSFTNSEDDIIERKQFHGKIVNADRHKGISILIDGENEIFKLPPDLSSIEVASPGEYRLRSTGKVIINPDFISTWIIKRPELSEQSDHNS
jgi:hypothetical protein